jgi:hypothetical protein
VRLLLERFAATLETMADDSDQRVADLTFPPHAAAV